MKGNIRGFMHLDSGQESVPALLADSIRMAMEEAMVEDSDRSRAVVGVADPQRL